MKMTRLLITSLTLLALSGCSAGFQDEFSCQKVGGEGGCRSMDEIRNDAFISQGDPIAANHVNNPFMVLPRRNRDGHPTRTQDTVRKVVVFPFESTHTNAYIDTMDIYIVLDESAWSGRPVQSIKKD